MKTRITQHANRLYLALTALLTVALLSACGGGTGSSQLNVGTGKLVIDFPVSLSKHLTDEMELKAKISVDNGTPIDLVVDRQAKTVTGTIKGVEKGDHVLLVEYIIVENGAEISIATGTINITVGDFEILALVFHDFIYKDDDHDGITNIAELEFGTDWANATSKPESHGIHGSENYAVLDKPINESIVIGTTTSTNYSIQ